MKFVRWAGSIVLAGLVAAGCRKVTTEGTAPDAEPVSLSQGSLPVTRLRAEPYSFAYSSGFHDSALVVVRDAVEWRSAWTRVHDNHSEPPPLPAVDFSSEMVIVAALGTKASGGFSIYVDSAYQRDEGIEVVVRRASPGARCGVTAALTQPVDVARIPASADLVTFRVRSEVQDCE